MKDKPIKPIIVIAGEPFSVFSEILFKALKKFKNKKKIILIASKELIFQQMKQLKFKYLFNEINEKKFHFKDLSNNKINIININFKFHQPFDGITNKSNIYIENCFNMALRLLKRKNFSGVINGPISKKNFLKKKFLGITEFLAFKTKTKNVTMLIYNNKLSVSPVTTHVPLKYVYKKITERKIINQVELIVKFYKKRFKVNPKIAITGLNPHCESNYESSEEIRIIKPAIKKLINKKYKVKGPYAADTIFMKEQSKKYDIIVGMYHDQVLAPIKTIFGFNAINITLGLPFIRISPDHGPNHDMLGKNISSPKSLIEAFKFLKLK